MCQCGRDHQPRERSVKCNVCGRLTLSYHAVCEEPRPVHYLPGVGLSEACPPARRVASEE